MQVLLLLFLFFSLLGHAVDYVSHNALRKRCDFIFDERERNVQPEKMRRGDVIFATLPMLAHFSYDVLPHIREPFILVTHNGDGIIPGHFPQLLEDPRLLAWFGTNPTLSHPKLHPIPIGIRNSTAHNPSSFQIESSKSILFYLNFHFPRGKRQEILAYFETQPFCTLSASKPFPDYLQDLAHSCFVLSPEGVGMNCYRTWETLVMGSIPVVKSSPLDPLYAEFPILIVNEWEEITEEFLSEKYTLLKDQKVDLEKLTADYWMKVIRSKTAM